MKKISLIILLVVLTIGLGYHQFGLRDSSRSENASKANTNETSNSPTSSIAPAIASVFQSTPSSVSQSAEPARAETIPLLEAALNQPVSIEHGGALRELALAKDELYVRNSDGIGRVVSIPTAGSASDLLVQIEKLQKETGSAPELILYPLGAARNDSTRRIVTRDILIEADSRSAADSLASDLSFKSAPIYAQGKYIYEAASSPEALAFFVKTSNSESPYVTPLLGSMLAKRAVMPNDQLIGKQWHLKFQNQFGAVSGTDMNVESVWNYPKTKAFVFGSGNSTSDYIRGKGVTIGIVDDGMEWSHPDLLPNVKKNLQKDWNGKDNDPKPSWFDAHGTACAGVAAARGNNKIGVSGVAPEASLVGMRLIAGAQTDADEAEAFSWFKDAIEIKSNSWGPDDDAVTLEGPDVLAAAALKYAVDFGRNGKGSIITWAGGNGLQWDDNSNYDGYANSIYTIAVAAMDSYGAQSYYSERGANLVITAPSNGSAPALGIMTTDNKGPKGYNYGFVTGEILGHPDNTETFGGTSSATPAISGVIALMLQRNPNLGWRDVQEILMRSAAQVDSTDPDWITANRTDHVTGNLTVPFHFNHKFGAGLVDAAAAVALSGNWTNLKPQKSETVTTNATTPIAATGNANGTITRNFTVNGTNLRAEHATLALTVTDIPKGDLTVTLTSPGNTTSILCEPHSDVFNNFDNWTFMTVRNWAESSNGSWTLSITNNGTSTGNLTNAELVVYGTPTSSSATTSVTLAASTTLAPLSTNITLTATAAALAANGTVSGNITGVQFFQTFNGTTTPIGNGTLTGNATNPAAYTLLWNTGNLTAGNYSITANATSSSNVTSTSNAVSVQLDPILVAGWDFQTLTSNKSSVPLTTALMSARTYNANFGNGNGTLLFNGSNGSSQWKYSNGEIFAGTGTDINAAAGFSLTTTNPSALLLRGGKNLSAKGKSLIFRCASTANKTYTISYAAANSTGGFGTHTWAWSNNATSWSANTTISVNSTITTKTFSTSNATTTGILYLRLTPSGATSASGSNLIDNVQIQSN